MDGTVIIGLILLVLAGLIAATWYQSRNYKAYMSGHVAETEKLVASHHRVVAQQDQLILLGQRQAEALERIATALEQRRT